MSQPSLYITPQELFNAPLGLSLRNVPAQGNTGPAGVSGAQNYEELMNQCYRASALVDNICQQILGATSETEELWSNGFRAGIDNNNYLWIQAANFPVISVSSFQYGFPAIGGTSWNKPTLSDLIIMGPRSERIVYPGWFQRTMQPPIRIQTTYLAGYPNALLTGTTTIGATTLPLSDLTGIVAGTKLTIYDGGNTEEVSAVSTWTPATGAGNLTLAAATSFAHTPVFRPTTAPAQPYDISVSAFPADLKEATLEVAKVLVETRGATALVMGRTGNISGTQPSKQVMDMIPERALSILQAYSRTI